MLHLLNFLLVYKNQEHFHFPCEYLFLRVFNFGPFIRYISYWNIPWFIYFFNCVMFIILGDINWFWLCLWFFFCVNILLFGFKRCVGFLNQIFPWFFYSVNCVILFCWVDWCAIFIIFLFPSGDRSLILFNLIYYCLFQKRSLLFFNIITFRFFHFIFILIELGTS